MLQVMPQFAVLAFESGQLHLGDALKVAVLCPRCLELLLEPVLVSADGCHLVRVHIVLPQFLLQNRYLILRLSQTRSHSL